MKKFKPRIYLPTNSGFNLVEIAVVLVIAALLAMTLMPRLSVQIDQQRLTDDQALLKDANAGLKNFIMLNGRMPCPATATSNGYESLTIVTPAPALQVACNVAFGYLPGRTLGLTNLDSKGLVPNAWGKNTNNTNNSFSLRYAVTDLNGVGVPASLSQALVNISPTSRWPLNGQKRDDIQAALNLTDPVNGVGISLCTNVVGLTLASLNCGVSGAVFLTDVLAVIISPGAAADVGISPFEIQNNIAGAHAGRAFYRLPYAGSPVGDASALHFDDTFEVITFSDLLSTLIAGGWTPNL